MFAWEADRCCLCGNTGAVKHCPMCGHDFCERCRANYFVRGWEAFKAFLGQSRLICGGVRHG